MTKILPWITGIACLIYIYGWYKDIQYPAYVPLIWCFGCFVNDLFQYLENK
jgi:hypothetical protein